MGHSSPRRHSLQKLAFSFSLLAFPLAQLDPLHAQAGGGVMMPVTGEPHVTSNAVQAPVHLGGNDGRDSLQPVTWASTPIRIGVLDFRNLNVTSDGAESRLTSGGGNGTAVADQLAEMLEREKRFQIVRIDMRSVALDDVAGAVRAGRGQDVDALLIGDLDEVVPVITKPLPRLIKGTPPAAEPEMHLHAGLIDARSGQLLLKTDATSQGSPETRVDFATEQVLATFDQDARSVVTRGMVGKVTRVSGMNLTFALKPDTAAKVGDLLLVVASGITKDLASGTLRDVHNVRAGHVRIVRMEGASDVQGTFEGELLPKPGDMVAKEDAH